MRNITGFIDYLTRFVSLFTIAFWGFLSISHAQPYVSQSDPVHQIDFKDLKKTSEGIVQKILGPYTVLIEGNQVVKLNGVECLNYSPIDQSAECIQAYENLKEKLPENSKISLFQTLNPKIGRVNRMDEQLAHVVLEEHGKKTWVQGAMLRDGFYRVRTTKYSPEIADTMYNLEHVARLSQVGIWSKDANPVRTAENITSNDSGFSVVEGKVKKVARVRNNVYLNFGDNWKTDFTIGVPSNLVKQFSKQGINLAELGSQDVRVRGWVRDYNGPYIELSHVEQLEISASAKPELVKPNTAQSTPTTPERPLSPMEQIIAQSKKTNTGFGHIVVTPDDEGTAE